MNIKEAAARTGLSPDTLRYYEKEGLIPSVRRDESGYRDYDERTLSWIELIQRFRHLLPRRLLLCRSRLLRFRRLL